tara:strand:+ start:899 stop:1525 length:627 start_codon:yes stop_codon:yes gene_type:complete
MIKKTYYWNNFYLKKTPPVFSSNFAKYIGLKFHKKINFIIDLGCGNGRDTVFFLKRKIYCIGIDKSKIVIKKNKKNNILYKEHFLFHDFSKLSFNKLSKKKFSVYLRFSLHSLNLKEENSLIKNLSKSKKLEYIFIETRTIFDELYGVGKKISKNEFYSDHYRRFINPKEIKKKLSKNFDIIYFQCRKNFAKYKKENPKILRIICKKK